LRSASGDDVPRSVRTKRRTLAYRAVKHDPIRNAARTTIAQTTDDVIERMARVKAAKRRRRRVALMRAIAPAQSDGRSVGSIAVRKECAVRNWLNSNMLERTT
jgi:hypothetical protein